ncbi:MAG: GntR family transcriptional regulator, partial [Alphaproteobacteria bacterium]
MTIWLPDLAGRSGPRYRAIADSIAEAVGQGVLAPGDKLPPQRQLAWRLEVTVGTVSRGYMLAEQRGLVSG